jgi:hypothetical protein
MAGRLPIYLVDFSCFSAPDELKVDYNKSQEAAWRWKVRSSRCGWASQQYSRQPQRLKLDMFNVYNKWFSLLPEPLCF